MVNYCQFLKNIMAKDKKTLNLRRYYEAFGVDLPVAFYALALEWFGKDAITGYSEEEKRQVPLSILSVKISPEDEVHGVIDGVRIENPDFNGIFHIGSYRIQCEISEQFADRANQFLNEIEARLAQQSIYKSRAFTVRGDFLDLSHVSHSPVVFNEEVLQELNEHIWTLITEREACSKIGIKFRRKVLLSGPFGAGKTQIALITALRAVQNGITFLWMPPTHVLESEKLRDTIQLARKLQPTLIFIEDIDYEQRKSTQDTLNRILSEFDGVGSKSDQIVVLMSTNYQDRIHGALQRPGRIDHIITVGKLTGDDIRRLIEQQIPFDVMDSTGINWDNITENCRDFPPAFVVEVCISAKLAMLSRGQKNVSEDMLVKAAKQLRPQFNACQKAISDGQYL